MQSIEQIRERTRRRIDEQRRSPGIAVAWSDPDGGGVIVHGQTGDGRPIAEDTLFEIGSITKAFAALLLADASVRGELSLDDHLVDVLPAAAVLQTPPGRPITLTDLATHAAGLPSFPPGSPEFPDIDGWSAYTTDDLLRQLADVAFENPVGQTWSYANSGYALIGLVLERVTGKTFEALLRERVLIPLGLADTTITLTPAQATRTAIPHSPWGVRVRPINVSSMPAAGGLWSTAADVLKFLQAALDPTSPLAPAFAAMLAVSGPAPDRGLGQRLGWFTIERPDDLLVGHNGGTLGMASSASFAPASGEAVVVLSNANTSTAPFAINLLRPDVPGDDAQALEIHPPIALDAAALDRCVGRYELTPDAVFEISRDGAALTLQGPNMPPIRLAAAAPDHFFAEFFPLALRFELPTDGAGAALSLQMTGSATPARRIAGTPSAT